jgi:hypothetical protein
MQQLIETERALIAAFERAQVVLRKLGFGRQSYLGRGARRVRSGLSCQVETGSSGKSSGTRSQGAWQCRKNDHVGLNTEGSSSVPA